RTAATARTAATDRTVVTDRTGATARMGRGEPRGGLNGGVMMVFTRLRNGQSAADTAAGGRQRAVGDAAANAPLVLLGMTTRASALIITGGPTYSLPGGGSCTVSGVTAATGGATVSCTGVNLTSHTNIYFGVRNSTNVNGQTMTGAQPAAAS